MRFISAVTISMLAAACGGGKDPVDIIDSAPKAVCGNGQLESPEQCDDGNTADGDGCSSTCTTETTVCSLKDTIPGLTLMSGPNPPDLYHNQLTGPNMGRKRLSFGGRLPAELGVDNSQPPNDNDFLIVELFATAGVFVTNQAKNFDSRPGAAADMVPYDAAAFIFGDADLQSGDLVNLYWAQSGSITLTATSETQGQKTTGSISATNFSDVDMTGNVIPGGCATSIGGLNFDLTQGAETPDQKPGAARILQPGDVGALTVSEVAALEKMLEQRRAKLQVKQ
ncbi:MAG: DUF4215 domain-containing protein [Deltaproteobacteria bacterium]|nr:DUF4215 domain-containing protein [Deltaproteobacteria bacterium]